MPGTNRKTRLGNLRHAEPSDAEIDDLDGAIGQYPDIAWFDVAMNNAFGVRVVETLGHLDDNSKAFNQRQLVPLTQFLGQICPVQILHHDVRGSILLRQVVDRDDVRVSQTADRPCLLVETFPEVLVELLGHDLDGHRPANQGIPSLVHSSHSPCADLSEDLVLA